MQEINYIGNELELFQHASVWKNYYGKLIRPYLKGNVLEVGAGIGSTTSSLCDGSQKEWLCVEPDPLLFDKLEQKVIAGELPACCKAIKGTTSDLPVKSRFDAIMYIDVIEHIENDAAELEQAYKLLADGGHLIVLVPAHQYLYNEFDKAIGHYRRYNKAMLKKAAPLALGLEKIRYLDSCGLFASLSNKYFLKQQYPTIKQIKFWNNVIVPVSKLTDIIFNYSLGKTVVAIWKKQS
ncbi:class I SAM-dependent methyltransferase [Flavitalea sp.]|nr:class I SAM-dependent methyltransferase [Flavitalea sp.]